jgi:hypothetical protein
MCVSVAGEMRIRIVLMPGMHDGRPAPRFAVKLMVQRRDFH